MEKAVIYTHEVGKVLPMKLKLWPHWSLGVRAGNFIVCGGQPGVDNRGNVVAAGEIYEQTRFALENLRSIVEAGGGFFRDVVKVRAFLGFPADYPGLVRAFEDYFAEHFPAGDVPALTHVISPVGAARDPRQLLVEIEAIAATERASLVSGRLFPGPLPGRRARAHVDAVRAGNLVFTSGQLPIDEGGELVGGGTAAQCEQVLANLETALAAAGLSASDIVRLTSFIDESADLEAVQAARASFLRRHFAGGAPATTTMLTPLGLEGVQVGMEAIAASGKKTVVRTDAAYQSLPSGEPYVQAVKVELASEAGSWLRRLTWPTYPPDVDRAAIGGELERLHPLGHLVFLSSQAPLDRQGRLVGEGDPAVQSEQVFANLEAITEAAGGAFSDIVNVNIFVRDRKYYEGFNEVRIRFVEDHYPDKNWFSGAGVSGTPIVDSAVIEIEAIAALG